MELAVRVLERRLLAGSGGAVPTPGELRRAQAGGMTVDRRAGWYVLAPPAGVVPLSTLTS